MSTIRIFEASPELEIDPAEISYIEHKDISWRYELRKFMWKGSFILAGFFGFLFLLNLLGGLLGYVTPDSPVEKGRDGAILAAGVFLMTGLLLMFLEADKTNMVTIVLKSGAKKKFKCSNELLEDISSKWQFYSGKK